MKSITPTSRATLCTRVLLAFFLLVQTSPCHALAPKTSTRTSAKTALDATRRTGATMYLESPRIRQEPSSGSSPLLKTTFAPPSVRYSPFGIQPTTTRSDKKNNKSENERSVERASSSHGMPWRRSIDPTYVGDGPYYMPFWEWQMNFMKENLTNLRAVPTVSSTGRDMSYVENTKDNIRMHTIQFQSDEYRLIRMTLMDAGNKTQVFTSLWYPHEDYNLPVLGVDFLLFNKVKHVCISDFQPIQDTEGAHDRPYEHLMAPIRARFPSLQGKMTKRFYDENQHFSKQMLLSREDQPEAARRMVQHDLPAAFRGYLRTHVDLVKSAPRKPERASAILSKYKKYDEYSSTRDPAHGLLKRYFGETFADEYVFDVLFPLSKDGMLAA